MNREVTNTLPEHISQEAQTCDSSTKNVKHRVLQQIQKPHVLFIKIFILSF